MFVEGTSGRNIAAVPPFIAFDGQLKVPVERPHAEPCGKCVVNFGPPVLWGSEFCEPVLPAITRLLETFGGQRDGFGFGRRQRGQEIKEHFCLFPIETGSNIWAKGAEVRSNQQT